MPPRLAHKKSRKGCLRCKERKVKCSEEWPSCAACLRHAVLCEYIEDPRLGNSLETQLSNTESSRGGSDSGDTNESSLLGLDDPYSHKLLADFNLLDSKRHAVELYLLHRFKSSVGPSFSSAASVERKEIWVWDAVDLAFDFPYLRNALFAITALYLWITASAPRTEAERKSLPASMRDVDYAQLHRMYLNLSISQQRDALVDLNAENADAVGLAAYLHSVMATCLLSDDSESGQCQYSPPVQWLMMHASISTVFVNAVPFLKQDGPMMRYTMMTGLDEFVNPDLACNLQYAVPFQKLLDFRDPTDLVARDEESDPLVGDAYRKTVAYIGGILRAVQQPEDNHLICMRVVAMGHTIPKTFIRLLATRRPRALAIIANYMAFVKVIDGYWWFRHRAEKELSGIEQILPQQWEWALTWPLHVLQEPRTKIYSDPTQFQNVTFSELQALEREHNNNLQGLGRVNVT